MNCSVCDKDLPDDNDFITCSRCQSGLHYNCSGVSKSTWKAKGVQKKNEWECPKCRSRSRLNSFEEDSTDPAFIAMKSMMEKLFAKQDKIITEKMDEMKDMIANIDLKVGEMRKDMEIIQGESAKLRKELDDLRTTVECEKQYARSRNIILTGIPFEKEEDLAQNVLTLLGKMEIEIGLKDISTHRLPSKNKLHSPAILQLNSRAVRDKIIKAARKKKPDTGLINPHRPKRAIYFNDHLTPYFNSLMMKVKEFNKVKNY